MFGGQGSDLSERTTWASRASRDRLGSSLAVVHHPPSNHGSSREEESLGGIFIFQTVREREEEVRLIEREEEEEEGIGSSSNGRIKRIGLGGRGEDLLWREGKS
ncbi:hypothetical protein B296_00016434 [Ensete ventricosum]|uniref:Uncharacterized protein n=1 Tax=Ensete ventricosum TaxID=4639 RepID=A0A426YBH7_ENSVE|nr:hypothetical protein B296_00016434 [Ensete ventricosum]